ncbi:type IX secretion system membrane protein, PorP/SprF family [Leeuwenhoekiella marinoflava DSM 3653]|uniref:Type IX secretion system PorP/SprF family membrane protein n=3 Tax=Leeuwenhoekiella marinoflava TaxID=988 RepID=A0A4Q0PH75_9FLAO|nr:type IX secretion system PorP/SprF family membrane protein [Leeuwenhoekiella marinoflava]SHF73233.1 type IX secretion system membrane protein, PorP/SprF family [Leeuwenhoekiella marinoflava DSM 3653]
MSTYNKRLIMMKRNLSKLLLLVLLLIAASGYSQQDPQYTQYMYNPLVINPAYAGNRGVTSIVLLHRSQWVGLDGAPRTQNLSVHSPIGLGKVGMGFSLVNDVLGPARETYFNTDFSYTIETGAEGKFSFGLKGSLHLLDVDFSRTNPFNTNDPFLINIDNKLSPNVGVGVFYHDSKFYAGLSAPQLLQTDHFDRSGSQGAETFVAEENIHYYGLAGYVFDLNRNVKFKPSTLVKMVAGAPLSVDVNANFMFYDKLTLGASYRWSAALSGLVGFQVNDGLLIGFAYDRETTDLGNATYNNGTYELFLRFELFKEYNRMLTPRFF